MISGWLVKCVVVAGAFAAVAPGVRASLIADTFSGNGFDPNAWQVNLPNKDFQPLGLASNASATVSDGVAHLAGRAQLVTKQSFLTPLVISGDIRISNLLNGPSLPGYRDGETITIATRTNATYDYNYWGEAVNSVLFRAQSFTSLPNVPGGNSYYIETWDGTTETVLAIERSLTLPFLGTLRFTITDDGTNVSFHLAQLLNGVPNETGAVTVTAAATLVGSGNQVAFYDRESPNSDVAARSVTLDNVNISSTPEPGAASLVILAALGRLARRPHRCVFVRI